MLKIFELSVSHLISPRPEDRPIECRSSDILSVVEALVRAAGREYFVSIIAERNLSSCSVVVLWHSCLLKLARRLRLTSFFLTVKEGLLSIEM